MIDVDCISFTIFFWISPFGGGLRGRIRELVFLRLLLDYQKILPLGPPPKGEDYLQMNL